MHFLWLYYHHLCTAIDELHPLCSLLSLQFCVCQGFFFFIVNYESRSTYHNQLWWTSYNEPQPQQNLGRHYTFSNWFTILLPSIFCMCRCERERGGVCSYILLCLYMWSLLGVLIYHPYCYSFETGFSIDTNLYSTTQQVPGTFLSLPPTELAFFVCTRHLD